MRSLARRSSRRPSFSEGPQTSKAPNRERIMVLTDPEKICEFQVLYKEAWWAKRADQGWKTFEDLPKGARLGTASLRRQAQALHLRPDLDIVMTRGNVDTRIAKLERGEADAILLALSGLNRLGLGHLARSLLDPIAAPPAPGQGALAIETRAEDVGAVWASALNHAPTALQVAAERGALEALEGSCRTAVGAHAQIVGTSLSLTVEALTPDGRLRFRQVGEMQMEAGGLDAETRAQARALGRALGLAVKAEGGALLLLGDH